MGTETCDAILNVSNSIITVKLNNPLMGTETASADFLHIASPDGINVKLNNPLMGTETIYLSNKNVPIARS